MNFELKTLEEYSDEALIAELRRVAEELNGQRLTVERFNSLARVNSTTLRNRFGSWQVALDKAGISEEIAPRWRVLSRDRVLQELRDFASENPGVSVTLDCIAERLDVYSTTIIRRFGKWKSLLSEVGIEPVPLGRRYTDEECFENILTLWTHYGRQPHFGELRHPPSTVGPKAYTLRWGGWRAALSAFVKKVNDANLPNVETATIITSREDPKNTELEIHTPRSIPLALRYKMAPRYRKWVDAC